jgi:uncharacterized protein
MKFIQKTLEFKIRAFFLLIFTLNLSSLTAWGQSVDGFVQIPNLESRVTDLTGTLSNSQKTAISSKLAQLEERKGSQVAVLIVPTTQPEDIAQFSLRVVEKWKLGRSKVDDGVLLIIAKNDRRLRLEVGYALEGVLNDATSKRIISEVIGPYFKQGLFYEGVDAGLNQVMKLIDGESLPPRMPASSQGNEEDLLGIIFIAFVISLFIGAILRMIFGRFMGGIITGGIVGFFAWTLTGALFLATLAGLVGLIATIFGGTGGVGSSGGGFGGVGRRGRGFPSGGGFGSGGFGGGGGGFGGGGASGDW